jgi:hypothetical protein
MLDLNIPQFKEVQQKYMHVCVFVCFKNNLLHILLLLLFWMLKNQKMKLLKFYSCDTAAAAVFQQLLFFFFFSLSPTLKIIYLRESMGECHLSTRCNG